MELDQNLITTEQALIGSLMMRNEAFGGVDSFMEPDYFAEPCHQQIYTKIRDLVASGKQATPVTMQDSFSHLDTDGKSYLYGCAIMADAVVNPKHYAQVVRDAAMRRQILELAEVARAECEDRAVTPDEVATKMATCLERMTQSNRTNENIDNVTATKQILDDMKRQVEPIRTGYTKLDEAMGGGLYPEKSYGFAARKKVGKTITAGSISYNLNLQGVKHLFICGEMSPKEIEKRNLCRALNVYPSAFRTQAPHLQEKIEKYIQNAKNNIIYENAPSLTFEKLRRIIARNVIQHGITGFILDYWQLVRPENSRTGLTQHLDEVAQWIANYCREQGLWSITMAQINQEGNTRGGEGIRLAFDQVYQIHREDITEPWMWFEMMDTRYTAWMNIGSESCPGFRMSEKGISLEETV